MLFQGCSVQNKYTASVLNPSLRVMPASFLLPQIEVWTVRLFEGLVILMSEMKTD